MVGTGIGSDGQLDESLKKESSCDKWMSVETRVRVRKDRHKFLRSPEVIIPEAGMLKPAETASYQYEIFGRVLAEARCENGAVNDAPTFVEIGDPPPFRCSVLLYHPLKPFFILRGSDQMIR